MLLQNISLYIISCFITSKCEDYVFISLGFLFVCEQNYGKHAQGFSLNFQEMSDMAPGTITKIWGMLHLTLGRWIFPYFFTGNWCLLATLPNRGWTDFHEIFRSCWGSYQKQSATFWDGAFKTWIWNFLSIFWDHVFKQYYGKRVNRFSWNIRICRTYHNITIG